MKKCMIGERYGSLVVIEKVKIPGKPKTYWRCRCDCGNTCTVEDSHLKNGHTKSCGCRRRIRLQEKRLDLTGQRYGRLVVLGPAAMLTEKKEGRKLPETPRGSFFFFYRKAEKTKVLFFSGCGYVHLFFSAMAKPAENPLPSW